MRFTRRITIVNIKRPQIPDVNQELLHFGSALGLFNLRDKDKSSYRVFLELLKAAKRKEGLTSDEIAAKTHLSRGTIVYHLNKLMEAGIAITHRGRYYLREENLQIVVEELKKDIEESLKTLSELAKDIDEWMGS